MRFTVEHKVEGDPFALLGQLGALCYEKDHGHAFRVWKVEMTDAGQTLITYESFADPELVFS